jgi:peptide chain release factor 1
MTELNTSKLENIKKRYTELSEYLASENIDYNSKDFKDKSKEHSDLAPVVENYDKFMKLLNQFEEAKELASGSDDEMAALGAEEADALEAEIEELIKEIRFQLVPKDPNSGKNIIFEIRAGTGGDEAAIFVGDMFRMYTRYAENKGYKTEIMSASESDRGGYKEIIFMLAGKSVYDELKFEGGTHRVQRVPDTETQGRIHTSAITVAVLPEAEEAEVEINPSDLRIDVFRSSGPGGQSVNTTDSAVRVTHIPTGIVVSMQDEKSQHQNKAKALRVLYSRLLEKQQHEEMIKLSAERKSQIGTGDRSGRIRTYNYPQNRITDHRINLTLYKLDAVMEGSLDELINQLMTFEKEELIGNSGA